MKLKALLILSILFALKAFASVSELIDGKAPQTMQELWATFNPIDEALDAEVLYEIEKDGVVVKVLRINVATVKGKILKVAGVYGYPKGAKNLPALLQVHGGGQSAHINAVESNARRGYVTFSLAWAGRLICEDFVVNANSLKAFWDNDTSNKNYKLTTDWQDLEGYHAPYRWGNRPSSKASEHSLDSVDSPRNSLWFLWAMAGKRAITFLAEQEEVDANKIGVYGHSMGGHLTSIISGSDDRVKAAVPSCGGVNTSSEKDELIKITMDDLPYLKNMSCPIAFLSPSNDFNGHINDTAKAIDLIKTQDWRIISSPHRSHQDNPEYEIATILFFDDYLKGTFSFPKTPLAELKLEKSKSPTLVVKVDNTKKIEGVDIYYTTAGTKDREYDKRRFWHFVEAKKINAGTYSGDIAISNTQKPLWVYANVRYKLDKEYSFAGYYYRVSATDKLVVSSRLIMLEAEQVERALPKITDTYSDILLDSSNENWEKDFYKYDMSNWGIMTNKVSEHSFEDKSKLYLEIASKQAMRFVIVFNGEFYKEVALSGGNKVNKITLEAKEFSNFSGETLNDFSGLNYMSLLPYFSPKAQKEKGIDAVKGASTVGDKKTKTIMPEFKLIKFVE